MYFNSPKLSLAELLGEAYIDKVVEANVALGRMTKDEAKKSAYEKVDFFPIDDQYKNDEFLNKVGTELIAPFDNTLDGAPTNSFRKATHKNLAPLTGFGCFRLGEDGKLYLIGKSEHYHASLGHKFNGYTLIDKAPSISIKINKLRKDLFGEISHNEFDVLSEQAPFGSNGLRFNFDDGDIALAKAYTKPDIARAITESAALLLKEELENFVN